MVYEKTIKQAVSEHEMAELHHLEHCEDGFYQHSSWQVLSVCQQLQAIPAICK
jgi:hypothetical protein